MSHNVLKAENIKKTFKTGEVETQVLKGVDFCLDEGEFVAIVGESGSGKSTAFAIDASDDADAGAAEAQVNAEKAMMSASTRATVDFIFFIVFLLFLICIVLFLIIGKLRVFGHGEHVYRLIGRGYLRNEIEQIFILGGLFVLHIIIEPCPVRHGGRRRIDIRARGYEINGFAAPRAERPSGRRTLRAHRRRICRDYCI